ncbi:MAG: hypothetical protein ACP5E5_11205 [Acidobacteriaceae bacterium]
MGTNLGFGSLPSATTLLGVQEQKAELLAKQTASSAGEDKDAKIDQAAEQFEAILVGTWLKEAEQSFALAPGEDGDSDPDAGGQQMMGLGVQSLSEALAASGGIGIARMIATAMRAKVAKVDASHAVPSAQEPLEGTTRKEFEPTKREKVEIKELRVQSRRDPP